MGFNSGFKGLKTQRTALEIITLCTEKRILTATLLVNKSTNIANNNNNTTYSTDHTYSKITVKNTKYRHYY